MRRLRSWTLLGASLLLFIGVSPSQAADRGNFHFGKIQVQPSDSLAYQDSILTGKPITVVVLTDFKIDRAAVMEAINTADAVIAQASQNQNNAIFVKLVAPERCGILAYLGQTPQQVELLSNFLLKTTAATASRVAGECSTSEPGKMFDDVYEFRLPYDAPVTAIPQPSALPADGGEPGQAFVALVKAIRTADWDGAHLRLPAGQVPAERPKAADLKDFFHGLSLNYPKSATVTGGLTKGNRAQIDVRSVDYEGRKLKGTVAMKKVAGQWQVVEQYMFYAD